MNEVILVTRDKELSAGLKSILLDTQAHITAEFAGMKAALEGFPKTGATMTIIDMFIPDGTGLELLKTLSNVDEACLFVMLLRVRTRAAVDRAFRYGAHDVLIFPVSLEILRDTIFHRLASREKEAVAEEIIFHKPADEEA